MIIITISPHQNLRIYEKKKNNICINLTVYQSDKITCHTCMYEHQPSIHIHQRPWKTIFTIEILSDSAHFYYYITSKCAHMYSFLSYPWDVFFCTSELYSLMEILCTSLGLCLKAYTSWDPYSVIYTHSPIDVIYPLAALFFNGEWTFRLNIETFLWQHFYNHAFF